MGQAKARGSYEQRLRDAQQRDRERIAYEEATARAMKRMREANARQARCVIADKPVVTVRDKSPLPRGYNRVASLSAGVYGGRGGMLAAVMALAIANTSATPAAAYVHDEPGYPKPRRK